MHAAFLCFVQAVFPHTLGRLPHAARRSSVGRLDHQTSNNNSTGVTVGCLGFEFCMFVTGWRHALRSEWPFIIILLLLHIYLFIANLLHVYMCNAHVLLCLMQIDYTCICCAFYILLHIYCTFVYSCTFTAHLDPSSVPLCCHACCL